MPRLSKGLKIYRPEVAEVVNTFNTALPAVKLLQAQKLALTKLYRYAMQYGAWDDMLILNLFLNDSEQSKYNFRNPAKFQFSFPNGITNTTQGVQADGVSQYYRTGFRPSLDASTYLNDFALDVFIDHTTPSGNNFVLGVTDSSAIQIGIQQSAPAQYAGPVNAFIGTTSASATQYVNTQSHILLTIYRKGNTVGIRQNGQKVVEATFAPTALPSGVYDIYGFCRSNFGTATQFTAGTHKHFCIRKNLPTNGNASAERNEQLWAQALMEYHQDIGRIGKSIIFLGDSITFGMNTTNGGYPKLVADALGLFKQNWGQSGERFSTFMDTATKAQNIVPFYNPLVHDSMYQAYATNDQVIAMPASTYATYLTSYLDLAISRGWPPSKLYIIPSFYQKADSGGTIRGQYYAAAAPIIASYGVKMVDLYTALKTAPSTDTLNFPTSDGTHPNDAGQVVHANAILASR